MMHSQFATNELPGAGDSAGTDAIAGLNAVETSLGEALVAAKNQLTQFAQTPTALQRLDEVFEITDLQAAKTLLADWRDGVFGNLPEFIELLDEATLQGAQGAYSAANNTIYIEASWVELDSLTGLTAVLLEEFGHHFDTQVNPGADTTGDEGELFAAALTGVDLTAADLARMQSENDWAELIIDGAAIAVEQSETADFNQDGQPDILWRNRSSGDNVLWFMGGEDNAKVVSSALLSPLDGSWDAQGVADFDQDGNLDILWRQPSSGLNALWLLNADYTIKNIPVLPSLDSTWDAKGIADFDQDGNLDILWRQASSGLNALWLLNADYTVKSIPVLSSLDGSWDAKGVADFNQDGNLDILWRQASSGLNAVWLLNADYTVNSIPVLPSLDSSWDVKGVAYYNQDSNPDIIWRQASSGLNAVWLMEGANSATVQSIPILSSVVPGWDIGGVANGAVETQDSDLRLQQGSASLGQNETVLLSAVVQNQGTGQAGDSNVKYWLSLDNTLTPGGGTTPGVGSDVELTAVVTAVDPIDAGQEQAISATFDYSTWEGGNYFIIAKADADEQVAEANDSGNAEDNNTLAIPITIPPLEADLQITSISVPTQVVEGDTLNISAIVTNDGRSEAGPFTLEYYRSSDGIPDNGNDTSIGAIPNLTLDAGASTQEIQISLPNIDWDEGNYYVFFEADSTNDVDEGDNESNNFNGGPVSVVTADSQLPDLVISQATILDDQGNQLPVGGDQRVAIALDQSIQLQLTVENVGVASSGGNPGTVRYYFSNDQSIDGSDYQLADTSFFDTVLDPNESDILQTNPIEVSTLINEQFDSADFLGFQFLLFDLDYNSVESDSNNNTFNLAIKFEEAAG